MKAKVAMGGLGARRGMYPIEEVFREHRRSQTYKIHMNA